MEAPRGSGTRASDGPSPSFDFLLREMRAGVPSHPGGSNTTTLYTYKFLKSQSLLVVSCGRGESTHKVKCWHVGDKHNV